jgi:hypothetical protein
MSEQEPRGNLDETQRQMDEWFLDMYGISFRSAVTMSKWDNDFGRHWKHVLEYLASDGMGNDPPDAHPLDR